MLGFLLSAQNTRHGTTVMCSVTRYVSKEVPGWNQAPMYARDGAFSVLTKTIPSSGSTAFPCDLLAVLGGKIKANAKFC